MIANGLNQATHEIIMEEERNDVLQSKPKHQTKLVQTERKEKHLLQANDAQINNLKLQEKIMYATINIS